MLIQHARKNKRTQFRVEAEPGDKIKGRGQSKRKLPCVAGLVEELRNLGGLAGTGLAADDHNRVVVDRVDNLRLLLYNRQLTSKLLQKNIKLNIR